MWLTVWNVTLLFISTISYISLHIEKKKSILGKTSSVNGKVQEESVNEKSWKQTIWQKCDELNFTFACIHLQHKF
jgi:hypothetical protein